MASASAISERATATCSPSPARNIVFSSRIDTVCSSNSLHSSTAVSSSCSVSSIMLFRVSFAFCKAPPHDVALLLAQGNLDLAGQLLHLAHGVLKAHWLHLHRELRRGRVPLRRGHSKHIAQRYQNE